ncbi:uncharacterized protein PV09_07000 [Verruconis gallopava]|uniref:Transmembrane protein n=1 Tax=Verruconis gallopava TaxID=253628 RepID=A0A0D1YL54_9PEZI|nr:uncharacterized protein PV09_07000 [Verruconis gallopava]KIW01522.1 hypothetical protein PV09_07000 [Verruconis gallopava]
MPKKGPVDHLIGDKEGGGVHPAKFVVCLTVFVLGFIYSCVECFAADHRRAGRRKKRDEHRDDEDWNGKGKGRGKG